MKTQYENNTLTIILEGKIDSFNAPDVKNEIDRLLEQYAADMFILDCDKLEYTSSAGLRMSLIKAFPLLCL